MPTKSLLLAVLLQGESADPLSTGGWILMSFSILFVLVLVLWCYKETLFGSGDD